MNHTTATSKLVLVCKLERNEALADDARVEGARRQLLADIASLVEHDCSGHEQLDCKRRRKIERLMIDVFRSRGSMTSPALLKSKLDSRGRHFLNGTSTAPSAHANAIRVL